MSAYFYVTPEPVFWPKCEEVDISEGRYCPNCDHHLFCCTCTDCGGEGGYDGYEEDPLWYDAGDMIPCSNCRGRGYHEWCPRCRWDACVPNNWNRPEHRGMAIIKVAV